MATRKIEINLPKAGGREETAVTRFRRNRKDYILFVTIEQDQDPTEPADHADQNTFLVYGHRSFTVDGPEGQKALEVHGAKTEWEKTHHVWPVFAYIHSGVYLKLGTDAGLPDRQWDVSMCGYCLVTKDTNEIPEPWKYAEGMIADWNQYLSGDVWGCDITLHELKNDDGGEPIEDRDYYRFHKNIASDSCWGFYGYEYACEEAKDTAEAIVKGLSKKRRAA